MERRTEHDTGAEGISPRGAASGERFARRSIGTVLKWFGVAVGSLVVLALICSAVWSITASSRLEKTINDIRSRGLPLTGKELNKMYRSSLEGENAAKYYEAAFKLLEQNGGGTADELPLTGSGPVPALGEVLTSETAGKIESYLQTQKDIFLLIEKASEVDGCVYDLDFAEGAGLLLSHLGKMRQAARLLGLRGLLEISKADTRQAVRAVGMTFRLGNSLRNEPILISMLVRVAVLAMGIDQVERIISSRPLPDGILEELDRAVGKSMGFSNLRLALLGERSLGVWVFNKVLASEGLADLTGTRKNVFTRPAAFLLRGSIKSQYATHLRIMSDMIEDAGLPPREANARIRARVRAFEEKAAQGGAFYRLNNFLIVLLLPALDKAFEHNIVSSQRLGAARVALAVEKFRNKNGCLPDSLEELAGAYIDEIPEDYFSQGKLKYRKDDHGYRVYSVGPDGQDNGGQPVDRGASGPDGYKGRDVVFRCVR